MANTFGQSKTNETAWQNNKEMNPAENSSVTGDAVKADDLQGDTSWRTTDAPVKSPTDAAFDDAESKKQNENVKTDSPGLTPEIGE